MYTGVIISGFWVLFIAVLVVLIRIGRHPNELNEDDIDAMYGTMEADLDLQIPNRKEERRATIQSWKEKDLIN